EPVEQDRAPAVLAHHDELAGPAPGEPPGDRRSDLGHEDGDRFGGRGPPGYRELSDQGEGLQEADGAGSVASSRLPWRVELHHRAGRYEVIPKLVKLISFRRLTRIRGHTRDTSAVPHKCLSGHSCGTVWQSVAAPG